MHIMYMYVSPPPPPPTHTHALKLYCDNNCKVTNLGKLSATNDLCKKDPEHCMVLGSQLGGIVWTLLILINFTTIFRQTEFATVQSQYQKLHGLCRSSIGSVREGLLSLEERFAADKIEVPEIIA